MAPPRLLLVTAHPDDEVLTFGGLIHLSSRAGVPVTLVCTTRGEVGEIADPALATPDTLGQVREGELRAACEILGVAALRLLDFRDSGVAGTPTQDHPRAFCRAPAAEVVPLLVRIIREVRPTVVVTWEPADDHGHPDHVAASHHATAAFDAAGREETPELGPPHAPAALYWAARPLRLRDEARAELLAHGVAVNPGNPRAQRPAAWEPAITLSLDVMAALEVKKTARAAHRTQATPMWQTGFLSADLQRRFLGTEYFHRARPAVAPREVDDALTRLLGLPVALGRP
jgi:LmbE family N-acetylglucosaminyl deacetylase